ncbi:MAG: hypothetical protein K2M19_05520 [Muribaculaceae bacterium]|nr:hypothetical protein [Muribaculaceae bacterium]
MRKLILMAVLCLGASGASAEITFSNLNNIHGTNIVLVDTTPPKTVRITDAVFHNDGVDYQAKDIRCDVKDGVATYRLKFKRLTRFNDPKVTVTINGEKKTVKIQKSL